MLDSTRGGALPEAVADVSEDTPQITELRRRLAVAEARIETLVAASTVPALAEERFRQFVESSFAAVIATDKDGTVTYANAQMGSLLGRSAGELLGLPIFEFMPPAEADRSRRRFKSRRQGRSEVVDTAMLRADGTKIEVRFAANPLFDEQGEFTGAFAIVTDMTPQRLADIAVEAALRDAELNRRWLEGTLEALPVAVWLADAAGRIVLSNPAAAALWGGQVPHPGEVAKYAEYKGWWPETGKQLLGEEWSMGQTINSGRASPPMLIEIGRLDGTRGHAIFSAAPMLDAAGRMTGAVAVGVDMTEQVLARKTLERTEARLRDQFAKLPVATYLWEKHGDTFVLLDLNELAAQAKAYPGCPVTGLEFREMFPEHEDFHAEMLRALRDDIVVKLHLERDIAIAKGRRSLEMTIGPQQPDRVLVHAVDVTERLNLEAHLRQAQKMEAVGRLAGGIAHDFNNLLTVIGAHSSFLLESLVAGSSEHEDAEAIHKAGTRAARLTEQLLAFSRKQILKPASLDINAIVQDMRAALTTLVGAHIEIKTLLSESEMLVRADPSQINLILINLALNARDAMQGGGVLTISTSEVEVSKGTHPNRCDIPAGPYALIDVIDTGTGIDATPIERIFEPFFTTKGTGKGTGLGLSTVFGIVKQSGGCIHVASKPGEGSRFSVYLPRAASGKSAVPAASAGLGAGSETILVVDDEPGLRAVTKRVLASLGYTVLMAAGGAEALEISKTYAGTIELVLSDSAMPGMRGSEVVRLLQEQRPTVKALFMSGYTEDEVIRQGILFSGVPFLQKPFSPLQLSAAVREVLDG